MVHVKDINLINHVTVIASFLLAASALTIGCPFDASGTGSLMELTECSDATECGDANPCTTDTCEASVCHHASAEGAVPDDGQDCTADACVDGVESHIPSAQGASCDNGAKYCNATGQCVPCTGTFGCPGEICFQETACVSCADGELNGGESDTDCGGLDCAKCTDGKQCAVGEDCVSGSCADGVCASCTDGVMNGSETGVDCGGPCTKCNGETCGTEADCKSMFCADGVCCDTVCSGTCKSCKLADQTGTCKNLPAGSVDDDPLCPGSKTCDGGGNCSP
jgi:hypothetical protein